MPAVYGLTEYVDAGGLVAYAASLDSMFSRAAESLATISRGEPPSIMPVEQAREFDLSINLKAANALGDQGSAIRARDGVRRSSNRADSCGRR